MTASPAYVVTSEEDFFNFVAAVRTENDLDDPEFIFPEVVFDGWPILDINVKGERYHSSITSAMLFGMSLLNEEIQRAYATIRYGSQNLQRLTNDDKQQLDIVFNISEGSSDAEGTTDKIINAVVTFLRESMTGMNGWQKMCIVIALVGAAGTCAYHYTSEHFETERHSADQQTQLVQTTAAGINQALQTTLEVKQRGETDASKEVEMHGETGKNGLVKQLASDPTVESVTIGKQKLNREDLNAYNGRQTVERERKEKIDTFFIKGVTRTGPTNQDINITVLRASNDEGFTIKASADVITGDELSAILDSLSSNASIKISYLEVSENGVVSIGQFNTVVE